MQTNIYFVCPISVLINQIYQEKKKINTHTHTYICIYYPHQCGKIELLEYIIRELILFGFYGIG